jgi:hypothetical protein
LINNIFEYYIINNLLIDKYIHTFEGSLGLKSLAEKSTVATGFKEDLIISVSRRLPMKLLEVILLNNSEGVLLELVIYKY